MADEQPVRITRLEVRRGHLTCTVAFAPAVPRFTSKALVSRVLPSFPALPRHACVNGSGRTFGDVIECTPVPHLLEHMVVDLQVREMAKGAAAAAAPISSPGAPAAPSAAANIPIIGTSEWIDEAAGIARIDASFADDQIALRALRDAVRALNDALAVMEGSRTSERRPRHRVG